MGRTWRAGGAAAGDGAGVSPFCGVGGECDLRYAVVGWVGGMGDVGNCGRGVECSVAVGRD